MKNTYIAGLVLAGLLIGCGGGNSSTSNSGTGNNNSNTPNTPTTNNTKTFTADVMPVLKVKCQSCHGSNGNFTVTSPSGTYGNISDLKSSVSMAGQYLLDKASNSIGHGGGEVVSTGSTEYSTIKSWVNSGADFN